MLKKSKFYESNQEGVIINKKSLFLLILIFNLLIFNFPAFSRIKDISESLNDAEITTTKTVETNTKVENAKNKTPFSKDILKIDTSSTEQVILKKYNEKSYLFKKTVKVKIVVNGKYETIDLPEFPIKTKTSKSKLKLNRIKDDTVCAVRINDDTTEPATSELPEPDSGANLKVTPLPQFEKNEFTGECLILIKQMHQDLLKMSTSESEAYDSFKKILTSFYSIIKNFSQYQNLCSLARLYYVEAYTKLYFPDSGEQYHHDLLKFYKQIEEQCSSSDDKIMKYVFMKVRERINHISISDDKMLSNCKASFEQSNKLYKECIDEMKNIYPTKASLPDSNSISDRYNLIFNQYKNALNTYKVLGDYYNSDKLYKAALAKYDLIPTKIELKYLDENKKEIITVVDVNKNPKVLYEDYRIYIETASKHLEDSDKPSIEINDIEKKVDDFTNLIANDLILKPEEKKSLTYMIDSFSKKCTINYIYFSKYETKDIKKNICASEEPLQIRANVSNDGKNFPIKVVLNSNVSKKSLEVKMKRDYFNNNNFYKSFTPFGKDSSTNLIKAHVKENGSEKDDLKHTFCIIDGAFQFLQEKSGTNPPNPFKKLKTSTFFNSLGDGLTEISPNDPPERLKINKNLLESMGFEVITAIHESQSSNFTAYAYVKNQADWVIMQMHGEQTLGGIVATQYGKPGSKPIPNPEFFPTPIPTDIKAQHPNMKELNELKITNLDFIIFDVCSLLRIEKIQLTGKYSGGGIYWRNKIGDKTVMLGYSSFIDVNYFVPAQTELTDFVETIKSDIEYPYTEPFKEKIIQKWLDIHKNLFLKKIQLNTLFSENTLKDIQNITECCAIYKNKKYKLKVEPGYVHKFSPQLYEIIKIPIVTFEDPPEDIEKILNSVN